MSEPLTPIERKIYQFLVDHLKAETYQPSVREIGRKFGIRSTKTVAEHLESLERKGCIARMPSRSRGVRILGVNLSPQTYTVRVYGGMSAANPGFTEGDLEGAFELDRALCGSPDSFLVRADSAGSECPGLLDGDYVLVEPAESVDEDEWVATRAGGRVCVTRWHGSAGAGPNGEGAADAEAHLLGRVRAVVRRFAEHASPVAPA